MRGSSYRETDLYVVQAVLMAKYNQPYSEIKNIPLKTALFLLNLVGAEEAYQKSEMKKAKQNMKKGR